MRRGQDIAVKFPGLYLVHHNLPGKAVDAHAHDEHILFFPLQGEIEIQLEAGAGKRLATGPAKQLAAGPGKMIYLPPETHHSFRSSGHQGERLIALLDAKSWTRAGGMKHETGIRAAGQLGKEILFYLLLHPRAKSAGALVDVLIQTVSETLEAAGESVELDHLEGKLRDERVRKAVKYLRARYADELSMDQLARASGLSIRSLNRLFLTETGSTPKQLLIRLRIERARDLIESEGRSVTDAAFEVGYKSLSPFIHAFRQITGQLPSELRRSR